VHKRTGDCVGLPKDHPLRFGVDIGADRHIDLRGRRGPKCRFRAEFDGAQAGSRALRESKAKFRAYAEAASNWFSEIDPEPRDEAEGLTRAAQ
jgi:hypothetical protein